MPLPRNTFQLASSPHEILEILNGNGHFDWARRQANLRLMLGWKGKQTKDTIGGRHQISAVTRERNAVAYRAAAGQLKEWLRRHARQWTSSGKILEQAPEVAKRVHKFLRNSPPQLWQLQGSRRPKRKENQKIVLSVAGLAALNFVSRSLQTPFDEAEYELGLLLLLMVTSEWSPHFYRCPECGTYFVRFRTNAKRPVCGRKCNETPRKRRQRDRDYRTRLAAAREAVKQIEQMPESKRSKDWRAYVAIEASRGLPAKLKFARTFVTQQAEAGKLKTPSGAR